MRFFQSKLFLLALFAPWLLRAQTPPQLPPGGLAQLQVAQPQVDTTSPVTATAAFDPPGVRVGEKAFYRVTVDATESSIRWPGQIPAPVGLQFGREAHGQMTRLVGDKFRPASSFAYEVRATAAGHFTITNFNLKVDGQPIEVPVVSLEVVAENSPAQPPARQLGLEISETNIYLGQPVRVRVLLPASPSNEIEALREVQFNGGTLMTDKTAIRQSVAVANHDGELKPTFIYEVTVTPMAAGPLEFSAQAFTAGHEFSGPISISGQVTLPGGPPGYVLLVSELVAMNVRPVPTDGELPGYTGALGKFIADPPRLSSNHLRVGEPVRLTAAFHGEGGLTRFVPPEPPRSSDWQIIADKPPGTGFTLIPLTDEARATPAIQFCAFDTAEGKFVDLTIPALPVTVVGESLPTELRDVEETVERPAPIKLSGLAPAPGKIVASLSPPQKSGWLVGGQFIPVIGLIVLWRWDQRRRFLEAHPEIVRRRQARRLLRRARVQLQKSVVACDVAAFVRHAANAMQVASAPHFPAHPQALVGGDVLAQLDEAEQNGRVAETVRIIFAAADSQFASKPPAPADLTALHSDVETVLEKLEAKL